MREFIDNRVRLIYSDFSHNIEGSTLCHLKTIRFDTETGPDYSNTDVQQLYLLRYFPAYLVEYKYLYDKLFRAGKLDSLKILSIGCGCCIDYYGAFLASDNNMDRLNYWGIDTVDWKHRDLFSISTANFVKGNISSISYPKGFVFNVIIFPKSLSDISELDFHAFLSILKELEINTPYVYLISSIMDKGFKQDDTRYGMMADIFFEKGFKCLSYKGALEMSHKGSLTHIDRGFHYPDDILNSITTLNNRCLTYKTKNKNCQIDCSQQLNKHPILTTRYISYILNLFEKA